MTNSEKTSVIIILSFFAILTIGTWVSYFYGTEMILAIPILSTLCLGMFILIFKNARFY